MLAGLDELEALLEDRVCTVGCGKGRLRFLVIEDEDDRRGRSGGCVKSVSGICEIAAAAVDEDDDDDERPGPPKRGMTTEQDVATFDRNEAADWKGASSSAAAPADCDVEALIVCDVLVRRRVIAGKMLLRFSLDEDAAPCLSFRFLRANRERRVVGPMLRRSKLDESTSEGILTASCDAFARHERRPQAERPRLRWRTESVQTNEGCTTR